MLHSGENYTINQLFCDHRIIQIPDMQRDYCWAQTTSELNGKSLVANYIDDLIDQKDNLENLQMGLLYAYESPKNCLQLCDGQQRLTTLYFLLCVMYCHSDSTQIRQAILTLDQNQIMPRFQYSIRESTLAFMTDFVREVVVNESYSASIDQQSIKNQDWYFGEYDDDPSIQNALISIELINQRITDLYDSEGMEGLNMLEDLILNRISFLYFDMQNRTYGEEQFVVLNTTGKPLTKSENLKPKLLGNLDDNKILECGKSQMKYYSDLWENWEYFFWKNKNKQHQSSDQGLSEFFRWIYVIGQTELYATIHSEKEKYNKSQEALSIGIFNIQELQSSKSEILDHIKQFFISIERLREDPELADYLSSKDSLSQIQCFRFLPLLTLLTNNEDLDVTSKNYIRLKRFLQARSKDDNVSKASITTTFEAIRIPLLLAKNASSDILDYRSYQGPVGKSLLSEVELTKLYILESQIHIREDIEASFWRAEKLECTQGNIQFLFDVMGINLDNCRTDFVLKNFNRLLSILGLTFEIPSDLLRRALLTEGECWTWHGNTPTLSAYRYTLGSNSEYFSDFILTNEKKAILINFLIKIYQKQDEISQEFIDRHCQHVIDNFEIPQNSIWDKTRYELVKTPFFIEEMRDKLFCVNEEVEKSYALKQQKVTGSDSYLEIA